MKLKKRLLLWGLLAAALLFTASAVRAAPVVGPTNGTLVIVGGGLKDTNILNRFIALAGGPASPLVLIPTANENDEFGTNWAIYQQFKDLGATNLTILHTRDRKTADSEDFVRSLQAARGVWIGGGRQWRLVDSYLHTRTQDELFKLLDRGGVIGGSPRAAASRLRFWCGARARAIRS
jgi:cyanophycinase-like exopeptidase